MNQKLSCQEASLLAKKYFGIEGTAIDLPGDVDYNFHIHTMTGKQYTMKLSRLGTRLDEWEAQVRILEHLSTQTIPLDLPEPVQGLAGQQIIELESGKLLRLQSWVPGKTIAEFSPRTTKLHASWGRAMGHLSDALASFDDLALHKEFRWDPSQTLLSKDRLKYFQNPEEKELAKYFWSLFEKEALPHLTSLRQSINFSDGHEMNLLSTETDGTVTGVIDFGDAVYSHTINEIAIACAYAGMFQSEPLVAMSEMVRSYHEVFPIEYVELALLYHLIYARLMVTVANAAWAIHEEPDNPYLQVSAQPAWNLLRQLKALDPAFVKYSFRSACGFEPCPKNLLFREWILSKQPDFHPVIQEEGTQWVPLDLSVGSLDLGNNSRFDENIAFCKTINRMLEDQLASFGYGGYCEARPIYTTEAYKVHSDRGPEWRTVHLGLDIWGKAGTPIYAPWPGTVHSFANNKADRDYGPCIIIRHEVSELLSFYTLYGHLDEAALLTKSIGQTIERGEMIAKIGDRDVNGGWPPHLHFQLIMDTLGNEGDFPGVAFPREKEVYASICPDPALMFPALKPNIRPLTKKEEILVKRKSILGKSLSVSYSDPLHLVRGYKQYLYDTNGRRYLDTCNNVAHVGHEHPQVVAAANRQTGLLNTNSRYLHDNILKYAEALIATLPPSLNVVHFVNSGSEANELALRMAKTYTGRQDMIAVEVGYHGSTGACVDVSSYKFDGKGGKGAPEYTQVIPIPDSYRGIYKGSLTGKHYAAHVGTAIETLRKQGRAPAGFICESILSCGGQIVLPDGYLKSAFEQVRLAGGVCIMDEVQVGFGRVGSHFWGFELQGVVPDIVSMGKPMGNGHPLGAVVTTRAIADAFANGMEYFSTYGGNPVSCAVGMAVLEVIQEEGLQEQARAVGTYLMSALKDLQSKFLIIGDVRGIGLFLGFELVCDRETLKPATKAARYLANRMRELGFLMSIDGPYNNVIKLKPPLCFTKANVDELLHYLAKVLAEDVMMNSVK